GCQILYTSVMPVTTNSSPPLHIKSPPPPPSLGRHARTDSVPIQGSAALLQSRSAAAGAGHSAPKGLSATVPPGRGPSHIRPLTGHMRSNSSSTRLVGRTTGDRYSLAPASDKSSSSSRPAAGFPSASLERRYGRGLQSSSISSSIGSYSTSDGSYLNTSQKITGLAEQHQTSPLMERALPTAKKSTDDDIRPAAPVVAPSASVESVPSDDGASSRVLAEAAGSASTRFVPEGGLVGIRNLGNTCYMNAVLQCLLHTTELYDNFVASENSTGEICSAFGGLIQDAYGTRGNKKTALEPKAFKKVMGRRNKQWAGYNQQDAQELLSDILDAMNTEMGGT
ncbi:hypothetical protein FOZ62_004307, partial [Perkinsus olseni]